MKVDEDILKFAQEEIDTKTYLYKGKKVSEIKQFFMAPTIRNKATFAVLGRQMLGVRNSQLKLYNNSVSAVLKTIRLTGTNNIAEDMSFMPIDFEEWLREENWEESKLFEYFDTKILLLFIYKQYPSGNRVDDSEMVFFDAKLWKMSEYDLYYGLRDIWEDVRYLIKNNKLEITPKKLKNGKVIYKNNLPKKSLVILDICDQVEKMVMIRYFYLMDKVLLSKDFG